MHVLACVQKKTKKWRVTNYTERLKFREHYLYRYLLIHMTDFSTHANDVATYSGTRFQAYMTYYSSVTFPIDRFYNFFQIGTAGA